MGIFNKDSDLFTTYRTRLKFRDRVVGGVPLDPKIIEGWLRSKAGITDAEEIRRATLRTAQELGVEVSSYDDLEKISSKVAMTRNTNGFKQDTRGLYLESRAIKAALKEATNILFAGERWGKTKKGPKSYLAERVFVDPDHISLGVTEPSGIELFIGHTTGPSGPQSNLTYFQFVTEAEIQFEVRSAEDSIQSDWWPRIWVLAQELGLGALRSQGYGRYDVEEFTRLTAGTRIDAPKQNITSRVRSSASQNDGPSQRKRKTSPSTPSRLAVTSPSLS